MDRITTAGTGPAEHAKRALAYAALAWGLVACTHDATTTNAGLPTAAPAAVRPRAVAAHTAPPGRVGPKSPPVAIAAAASAPSRVVLAVPAAPPVAVAAAGTSIRSAVASPAVVHAGQTETWTVTTSDDVTGVDADVSIYHFTLKRTAAGRFAFSFAIPPEVPPFFHGRYAVGLTAHGTSRASSSMAIDFE